MNKTSNLEFSVKAIFNDKYLIPIYQRNYAWGKDEIETLLDDISSNNNEYFIGSLVVREKNGVFEVIDGQQRLTTIYLTLRYLKHNIKGELKFEARQKSNETLEKIYNVDKWADLPSSEIVDGFKIIEKYFSENKKDESFKSKILNAKLLRVPVPNDADLNHFFEIMNTRGEQLEAHQIAKAKILKNIEKKDKKIAALVWDACADMDRYVQMSFEKKLRKQIFGDEWDKICDENKLFEIPIEDSDGAEMQSLSKILENESLTSKKIMQDEGENIRFSSIINFPNFLLQVNAAMSNNASSTNELLYDKKLIDNLKKYFDNSENAKNFIYNLLKFRFLFDKFIIKTDENDKKEGEKWSLKMLKTYRSSNKDTFSYVDTLDNNGLVVALQSCLRITYTSPRTMEWIFTLLKGLNENITANMQEILETYAKKKVKNALEKSISYPMCERIVLAYLDYILYRECIVSTKNSEPKQKLQNAFEAIGNVNLKNLKEWEFKFRDSIEHFYPQNPSSDSIGRMDDKILNSFGNLALVTTSGNSKFSNLAPSAKQTTYPNIITQSLKLILMSACVNGNSIDEYKQAISEHEKEMRAFLLTDIECDII
ncbi:GmrSD restriction endonuclease domain-containing protein [Campylobacter concisus]|uniref:GmrSD restriction endonuclease domain-containing protein n=1 Tax=Campylobacter concisus TaxID=199 RepID=UPI003D205F39